MSGKVGAHLEGTGWSTAKALLKQQPLCASPVWCCTHVRQPEGSALEPSFTLSLQQLYEVISKFPERKTKGTCMARILQGQLTELLDFGELRVTDQTENILSYFQSPRNPFIVHPCVETS